MRAIARRLDLNFKTVCRYLRADSVDSLLAAGVRVSGGAAGRALPGDLDEQHRGVADAVGEPVVQDAATRHVAGFARMIKDLSGDEHTLTKWMGAVDADLPPLRSFTAGLRRDLDAVVAGLTLQYNSGPVEGTVNRISFRRRSGFARPYIAVFSFPNVLDPYRLRPLRRDRVHRVIHAVVQGRRRGFGQAGVVGGHQPLDVVAQVVPQMPPVGDLHRAGSTIPGAVGPVPADHLHAGVGAQPAGEVLGLPALEHIHRPVAAGQVDQHRAVMMAAAQREIIHPEHPHPTDRRIRQPADYSQQRRPAHPHAQFGGQPRSRPDQKV